LLSHDLRYGHVHSDNPVSGRSQLILLSFCLIASRPGVAAARTGAQRGLPSQPSQFQIGRPSGQRLIEEAYARKELDVDRWALYHAYLLFDPQKLPEQYQSEVPEACGTSVLDEIHKEWRRLRDVTRVILIRYGFRFDGTLSRPAGLDSSRATLHFRIHYSVAAGDSNAVDSLDADRNGTPDYVDTAMSVLEYVWSFETGDSMGFVAPPPDSLNGVDSVDGGNNKYDVYLKSIPDYGLTPYDHFLGDNPNSHGVTETRAWASYIILRNRYPSNNYLRTTAAHEFSHAIQEGYDGSVQSWLQEATSVWCEGEVYDAINSGRTWLYAWFAAPWIPLDADVRDDTSVTYRLHKYGSWIFLRFISEHVGGRPIVRGIWEHAIPYDNQNGNYSFSAISDALADFGTDFPSVFQNFAAANDFLIYPPYDYRRGSTYPHIRRSNIAGDTTFTDTLRRHASRYYYLSRFAFNATDRVTITFIPIDPVAKFGIELVTRTAGTVATQQFSRSIPLGGIGNFDVIDLAVMNFDSIGSDLRYRLTVTKAPCDSIAQYDIIDLGTLGGFDSYATKINARGQVVGNASKDSLVFHAFLWEKGSMRDLDSLHPLLSSTANSINDLGTVVGIDTVPFLISGGVKTPLNSLVTQGPPFLEAYDLNNLGQIAGWGKITGDTDRALLFRGGVVTALNTPFDRDYQPFSKAVAINNLGTVVGNIFQTTLFATIPVMWVNAQYNNGFNPTNFLLTADVNDSNVIVGNSVVYDGIYPYTHASRWAGNNRLDLGVPAGFDNSEPSAINYHGVVVGKVYIGNHPELPSHAFVWKNGVMKDLNCLIAADPTWELQVATDINDSGIIVGYGSHLGKTRGFLLTPVHPTSVDRGTVADIPRTFKLLQNYPNPFNPATIIGYKLPKASHVTLRVYNLLGQEVKMIINEQQAPGSHFEEFDAGNLASGVYFYRLQTSGFIATMKMIFLK